ncbi:hypothetical protein [Pseudoalteromonas luteoviolacea]|uniref:Uncharacterized protein n=1 Tax=Pseudoalteromonas luteoviolacea (strain 2ta16) TaxID=1353533 RepID=V4GZM3_PSEL2|nr:hypothetical protein [Pseudoalteromonas luteoviolacea]ESP90646.1 hypothetical protein PL2TA16_01750 [Pseudoalteromonas luteoviolacea 2ta16]
MNFKFYLIVVSLLFLSGCNSSKDCDAIYLKLSTLDMSYMPEDSIEPFFYEMFSKYERPMLSLKTMPKNERKAYLSKFGIILLNEAMLNKNPTLRHANVEFLLENGAGIYPTYQDMSKTVENAIANAALHNRAGVLDILEKYTDEAHKIDIAREYISCK